MWTTMNFVWWRAYQGLYIFCFSTEKSLSLVKSVWPFHCKGRNMWRIFLKSFFKGHEKIITLSGMLEYYGKFVNNFGKITKSSTSCLRKDSKTEHTSEFLKCYETCKIFLLMSKFCSRISIFSPFFASYKLPRFQDTMLNTLSNTSNFLVLLIPS